MKVCQKCGTMLADDAEYCTNCGNYLQSSPESQPAQGEQQQVGQQPWESQPYNNYYEQQQQPYQNPPPSEGYPPVYQQSDYSPYTMPQKRTAPIVLGIIGLVFSFLLPIVTYPCSIVGVVMANSDNKRGAKNTSGLVLNIVALVIAALNSILGAILGMMGALSY